MVISGKRRQAFLLAGVLFLSACAEGAQFNPFASAANGTAGANTASPSASGTVVERDVEAPEIFGKTEDGLWDGRPSLGGVWVAHPDVTDPERVIIRNNANGAFVIGALFRRERENPGPRFQVSSDAAAALEMLAGAPVELSVTALRREEVPVVPDVIEPATVSPPDADLIQQQPLNSVAEIAANAIEAATADAAAAPVSALERPFIQIGIFSIQANADNTADMMRAAGVIPTITKSQSSGKTFWRVIVGPAADAAERSALLETVRGLGFSDAYAVTN